MNLTNLRHSVKSASVSLIPNPNHPLGQGHAYRALKAAGWRCYDPNSRDKMESHPTERVPVFRLGAASIRRNKTNRSHWIVEIAQETFELSASVEEITAAVETRLAEIAQQTVHEDTETVSVSSLAAQEAQGLESEYPEHAKRIALALALIESGELAAQQKKYGTEWQNLTKHGNWICDCPDSLHRQPVARFGRACKHCLAGEILARVKRTQTRVSMQKLASDNERRAARDRAYAMALAADPANLNRREMYQFGRHVVR